MLDNFLSWLDNPGRTVGIDPEQIDPRDRSAYRGAVLASAFDSLRSNGPSFGSSLSGIAEGIQAREEAEAKRRQQEQAQRLQQQLAQMFGGAAPTPGASGAPAQPGMPAAAGGAAPGAAGAPAAAAPAGNPNAARAEAYRRAAMVVAASNPDTAKKYMEIADQLEPRADFGQPFEVAGPDGKPVLVMADKSGNVRPVQGYGPKVANDFGQPFEVAGPDGKPVLVQADKNGNVRPVQGYAPKPATTTDITNYQLAQSQGYKGTLNQFMLDQRKAGAATTNVSLDTGKKFGDTLGTGIGESVNNTFVGAQAAQQTLGTVQTMRSALGGAITGPFADTRAFIARLQSGLGIAPGDTPDKLAATKQVVMGLAKAELAAAAQMKGQGQITESEREILRRAESGEINLTPSELKVVIDTMEATARRRIQAHQNNVQRLKKLPGAEMVVPFYEDIGQGAPAQPGAPGAGSIQDRAREELRRRGGR